jgi:hypothetical protein
MTIARLAAGSLVLASLLACRSRAAATPEPADTPALAQLCGHWRTTPEPGGVVLEERWRVVEGGLVGESVMIDAEGREQPTERFAIDVHAQGSTYRAQPSGAASETPFEQVEAHATPAGTWLWAWTNPAHDSPRRIEYELVSATSLRARIVGPPQPGGADSMAWTFERVASCR